MADILVVKQIMLDFSVNTGLEPQSPDPRRYLWTDSFATTMFFELYKQTQEEKYKQLALTLIDQVHNTLGKHKINDGENRTGWISGLKKEEGALHPTKGGLRIGKKLPERLLNESYNDDKEWDKDGQYFHYLTKWMQALCLACFMTNDNKFSKMAFELAKGVHDRFIYKSRSSGVKQMYWKMSIDLSRPLVPSMGHHDPLDGFLTYYVIQQFIPKDSDLSLEIEMMDLYEILESQDFSTNDSLGLGGLLCDIFRTYQLCQTLHDNQLLQKLLLKLIRDTLTGLKSYDSKKLTVPAGYRLAFREFGLSIGLQAVKQIRVAMNACTGDSTVKLSSLIANDIDQILEYYHLVNVIHEFWGKESNRSQRTWKDHLDINMVMYATSLLPDGFISLKLRV